MPEKVRQTPRLRQSDVKQWVEVSSIPHISLPLLQSEAFGSVLVRHTGCPHQIWKISYGFSLHALTKFQTKADWLYLLYIHISLNRRFRSTETLSQSCIRTIYRTFLKTDLVNTGNEGECVIYISFGPVRRCNEQLTLFYEVRVTSPHCPIALWSNRVYLGAIRESFVAGAFVASLCPYITVRIQLSMS